MLNIYHLRHDSLRIDCAMNSFRRQTRDQRHVLCNCSNAADIQSEKDRTLSQVVIDGNKTHLQKQTIKLAKKSHKTSIILTLSQLSQRFVFELP